MTDARAADCHAHVFCGEDYPYSPETVYRPHPSQAGMAAKFRSVLDAHGFTHGLLVGAGPYGSDNRCMLEAIAASGGRFKGIAPVKLSGPFRCSAEGYPYRDVDPFIAAAIESFTHPVRAATVVHDNRLAQMFLGLVGNRSRKNCCGPAGRKGHYHPDRPGGIARCAKLARRTQSRI
jgi:hypothetical protein